ncbi:MAG: nitroreductase family protein [Chloroflexi bacterium]|nr:nitroreductase family protein [Chloroflexota bacterium]
MERYGLAAALATAEPLRPGADGDMMMASRATTGLMPEGADFTGSLQRLLAPFPKEKQKYIAERFGFNKGDFRQMAGYLGLNQALPADASVNVFFLSNLAPVLETFGNRGYRAAQLDASITAGRLYLAAYAQGFGATGLTFFDDAVTDFFSPHAKGKSVMFLVALGKRARRG